MSESLSELVKSASTSDSHGSLAIRLSVIVPAYNEEATIVELLERVRRQRIEGTELEIILVDDCSVDGTRALIESRPDLYDQFVALPENLGKGGAVKAGLEAASGTFVIFQDADLEYNPSDYVQMMMPVLEHDADVVLGSRLLAPPYTRVHYFWHKVGNRLLTLSFNLVNNTTFTDIYSCYLLFRKNLLDPAELRTRGWEQQAEILANLARRGDVLYEVPISYHGRTYEEGKKIRAKHAIKVLWTILTGGFRGSD
ncbi:MAG: glycosyltransferase [Alphaproteobacteria bacterium]|nr:glycosyltransferase [Alphaproteobacteria bacterium]|tara:strand:+ start:479 stop:1243 length:765 start_codon:yes stop_codon:yes gene_type:complete